MARLARLNENENENENEGSGRPGGLFWGARFNTHKILRHAFDPNGDLIAARIPGYVDMGGWDAENQGWVYLMDFIRLRPTWFKDLRAVAANTWNGWDLTTPRGRTALKKALQDIVDAAGEREDRFAEILHQQDAEGCITYWMGMLNLQPGKHPNTYQLIRVARKLGEMIVMCLKAEINAARPSQICPAIIPMFDPPQTACYPAGHALQSYLISYFLLRVMPGIPQSTAPGTWEEPHEGLFALARRVSDNRVIGGVHFDIDNKAGFLIAQKIDTWIDAWVDAIDPKLKGKPKRAAGSRRRTDEEFQKTNPFIWLLGKAKAEFPQY